MISDIIKLIQSAVGDHQLSQFNDHFFRFSSSRKLVCENIIGNGELTNSQDERGKLTDLNPTIQFYSEEIYFIKNRLQIQLCFGIMQWFEFDTRFRRIQYGKISKSLCCN